MAQETPQAWLDVPLDDPQPTAALAEARRRCPVAASPPLGPDPRPRFNVVLWEDVEAVLRDTETFSSSIYAETLARFTGPTMIALDGADHRRVRGIVARAFQLRAFERWEHELVRPIFGRLIDAVAPRGRSELVGDVLAKFPMQVICGMYGIPIEDADLFRGWVDGIIAGSYAPAHGDECREAMRAYLAPIVADRREHPRGDLLSDLLRARDDEESLSEDELFGVLINLLVGGTDATYLGLGSIMVALLRDADAQAALRADHALIPRYVEEALRWEAPGSRAERITTRDVTIRGVHIPAGASVNVWLNSANYDESRFDDPERVDVHREDLDSLTFGIGPHVCLGINLARLELRVAVETMLERLPHLRLDPDQPAPVIEGTLLRGPRAVHVLFDPVA